jgi:hypothetical protein
MSIDKKKLMNILNDADIIILEYYFIDNNCAMIKCFMTKIFDFILIYIPPKLRFSFVDEEKNRYNLEVLEKDKDFDDYAKTNRTPDIDMIDDNQKSTNIYREMTNQYKKNIYVDGDGESSIRKINRQIVRMRIPFEKLKYSIAIQNSNIFAVSFNEDINIYEIKNYSSTNHSILYVINIKALIEKIEKIPVELENIREQYYNIIEKISLSNLESICLEKYNLLREKITNIKITYKKSGVEFNEIYLNIKNTEDSILKKYKNSISLANGIKKNSLGNLADKELNDIHKKKIEVINKGINFIYKYHLNVLVVEYISFDTLVMCKRTENNLEVLNRLLLV